jgi:hypothetical protein
LIRRSFEDIRGVSAFGLPGKPQVIVSVLFLLAYYERRGQEQRRHLAMKALLYLFLRSIGGTIFSPTVITPLTVPFWVSYTSIRPRNGSSHIARILRLFVILEEKAQAIRRAWWSFGEQHQM